MQNNNQKNALSLFDGMSCFQIALKELNIPIDNYYASEVDKHAIAQTKHAFPNTIHLGDVRDIDVTKLPYISILGGGSPCFTKDNLVLTNRGYICISEVVVNDYVYTHTGKYQKVLATGGKTNQPIFKVSAQGTLPIKTTSEHPFYVREMSRKWNNEKRTSYRFFDQPIWKQAKDLKKDDFLGFKINEQSSNELNLTKEECFIIGRYIADGHTRKDYRTTENRPNDRHWQLILSVGKGKEDAIKNEINETNYSFYTHSQSVSRLVVSSKRLVEIVEKHCGCGAINKFISPTLLSLPKDLAFEMLKGYVSGDGHTTKEGVIKITTISIKLALSLTQLIGKVYNVNCNVIKNIVSKTTVIEGRTVNQNDCYILEYRTEIKKQTNAFVENGYIWTRFNSLELLEKKEDVFNIEVENDNTYTIHNVIVHNCQSFSFAGKMKGMSTKQNIKILELDHYLELKSKNFEFEGQSYLFWEYMRILRDIQKYNPDVEFLLENVVMTKEWELVLSRAIGIAPIMINAALVSAQNRKRLFWTNIYNFPQGFLGDPVCEIPQPKDRGILLKDILEPVVDEKYFLSDKMINGLMSRPAEYDTFKPIELDDLGKARTITQRIHKMGTADNYIKVDKQGNVKQNQDKASCFTAGGNSGGNHSDMDLFIVAQRGRNPDNPKSRTVGLPTEQQLEPRHDGKTNCLTTVQKDNLVACLTPKRTEYGKQIRKQYEAGEVTAVRKEVSQLEPRVDGKTGTLTTVQKDNLVMQLSDKISDYRQDNPTHIDDEKHPTLRANAGGKLRGIGITIPEATKKGYVEIKPGECFDFEHPDSSTSRGRKMTDKSNTLMASETKFMQLTKDFRIRRLTPLECSRLQTVPEWYSWGNTSDTQIYRMLGNGWNIEVIKHILSYSNIYKKSNPIKPIP